MQDGTGEGDEKRRMRTRQGGTEGGREGDRNQQILTEICDFIAAAKTESLQRHGRQPLNTLDRADDNFKRMQRRAIT